MSSHVFITSVYVLFSFSWKEYVSPALFQRQVKIAKSA